MPLWKRLWFVGGPLSKRSPLAGALLRLITQGSIPGMFSGFLSSTLILLFFPVDSFLRARCTGYMYSLDQKTVCEKEIVVLLFVGETVGMTDSKP